MGRVSDLSDLSDRVSLRTLVGGTKPIYVALFREIAEKSLKKLEIRRFPV